MFASVVWGNVYVVIICVFVDFVWVLWVCVLWAADCVADDACLWFCLQVGGVCFVGSCGVWLAGG